MERSNTFNCEKLDDAPKAYHPIDQPPVPKRPKFQNCGSSNEDSRGTGNQSTAGGESISTLRKDEEPFYDHGEKEEENKEVVTIHCLFDELLQKIFSYIPAQDVFGVLSKVCVRWEQIAKDPDTLGQCQLFLDEKDSQLFVDVLREASLIGEVYISPFYPEQALQYLTNGPRVRKLVIIGDREWHPNWPSPKDLIALLRHNQSTLQQLSLHVDSSLVQWHKDQVHDTPVPVPSFQSIIAGMNRLTHLHLVGECWRQWDEWDLSTGHPRLHTLKIDSLSFISDECPFIRDLIKLCKPTLRTLYLPCQLPQDAVSLINTGVFDGSQVENLLVSTGCLRVVSQMNQLKTLAVSDNGKEEKDLRWFKESPKLNGVTKLTLQSLLETENEKEGFVWHLLSKFNNVEEFWGIESSVEVDTFNMFLKNNTSLRELHFLDFVGLEYSYQIDILEKCLPHLCVIDVSLSQLSEEVYLALRILNERRPSIEITYGDDYDEYHFDLLPSS